MSEHSSVSGKLLTFAAIVIIIAGLKLSAELIAPILFAFTLTVLVWPALAWLDKKGVPRGLSITLVSATVILAIILLILVVAGSLEELSSNIPSYTELLNTRFEPLLSELSWMDLADPLRSIGMNGSSIAQAAISFVSGFASSLFGVLMFLLTLIFMITASGSVVKRYHELPGKRQGFSSDFASWSRSIQVQYKVQTIGNLIMGAVLALLFLLLGIDYALLWGFLAFLLSYIPHIGLILASIPPILLTLIFYGWTPAIFAAIFIIVINFIMDNVITPRFIGAALRIPAAYIFISFLVCSYIFGILGAFLSLPIFLAVRQLLLKNPRTEFIGLMMGHPLHKGSKK